MADNGEILSEAEVDFLLAAAAEEDRTAAPADDGQTVTMRGDLDQINLADIFQTLALSKMEGVLRVSNPLEERRVHCHDGYVRILVPSRVATRRLGQRLIHAGLIQPEHLRSALLAQRKEKKPIGKLLIAAGHVTQAQIDEIIAMQVAEDLFALFTWRHGTFEFFKGELSQSQQEAFAACPEYEVNSLLLEVARRSDEWQSIFDAIGSLDEVPRRTSDRPPDPKHGELHRALLEGADGNSSYRDLAEQTTHSLFEFARAARDLVAAKRIANIDDGGLVTHATRLAEAGQQKKAVVVLQTLRDRPGDRALGVLQGMANALELAGEKRLAGSILLEAAQRQVDGTTALELARQARQLSPHDPETLSFLRTVLVAHAPGDSPELEKVTLDLLDALIESDLVPTALDIVADARLTGSAHPAVLQREVKARQKGRDVAGAAAVLLELAQLYDERGDRARALEAYEALLRLDRSRKDIAKLVANRKRSYLVKCMRWAAALASVAMIGGMGLVWWQHHAFTTAVASADQDITRLLEAGDRAGARQRWEQLEAALGPCEPVDDLQNRVAFAEAAETGRQQKLLRARITQQMTAAAELLDRGELRAALAAYQAVAAEPKARAEVNEVVRTRIDALLDRLAQTTKGLEGRLPPPPDLMFDRRRLQTNLADLQTICPPSLLVALDELATMNDEGSMPELLAGSLKERATKLLPEAKGPFARAKALMRTYEQALARDEVQRDLDPVFKAAVERERAYDFAGALELYRQLERQSAIEGDLRAHFRDRVSRNATIVKLTEALRTATDGGDFATAQQQLRALQRAFPDVPFDRLVRLPLRIESLPDGATVHCNGREIGRTPMVLSRVPAEPLSLSLSAPGFAEAAANIVGDEPGVWIGHLLLGPDVAWKQGGMSEVAPTVYGDRLLVVDRAGNVVARRLADGTAAWTFRANDLSGLLTRPVVSGDQVLFGSLDGELRALDAATGSLRWSLPDLPTEIDPVLHHQRLLLATTGGKLCVIDLETSAVTQSLDLPQAAHGPLVVAGNTLVVTGEGGKVQAFTLPGLKPLWQRDVPDQVDPTTVAVRSQLVVADDRGHVAGLDLATGNVRWQQSLNVEILGGPLCVGSDVLLTSSGRILRFDALSGRELQHVGRIEHDWAGAAVLAGTRLVAPLRNGGLQVFDATGGTPLYRVAATRRARVLVDGERLMVVDSDHAVRVYHRLR